MPQFSFIFLDLARIDYLTNYPTIRIWLDRYCRKAKAVFKELKKEPYVVELDQRGLLPEHSCYYFSLSLIPFDD